MTVTRFRIDVDERTWHETGDLIQDGAPPARILEMTLHTNAEAMPSPH